MEIFFEIHSGLTREGPGCNSATREAFSRISKLPPEANLLDIGCGPGIHTLELSRLLDEHTGKITASDVNDEYLDSLRLKVKQQGIKNIVCETTDMFDLKYENGSFDIVWAEGAIYIIGFEKGLTQWKRVLKPCGIIAVSELSWIRGDVPDDALRFWKTAYPDMKTVEENIQIARHCGFDIEAHFTLPESAWFDDYYTPMEKRINHLRNKYAGHPDEVGHLDEAMVEIDLYKKYSAYYGYEFYILKAS